MFYFDWETNIIIIIEENQSFLFFFNEMRWSEHVSYASLYANAVRYNAIPIPLYHFSVLAFSTPLDTSQSTDEPKEIISQGIRQTQHIWGPCMKKMSDQHVYVFV